MCKDGEVRKALEELVRQENLLRGPGNDPRSITQAIDEQRAAWEAARAALAAPPPPIPEGTPRTDVIVKPRLDFTNDELVYDAYRALAEHARQLERELAASQHSLEDTREGMRGLNAMLAASEAARVEAERERDEMRGALDFEARMVRVQMGLRESAEQSLQAHDEPTDEMLRAGHAAMFVDVKYSKAADIVKRGYKAMRAAALAHQSPQANEAAKGEKA